MTTPATQQVACEAAHEILGYYLLPHQAMVPSIIQRAIDSEIDRSLKLITQPEGANK